MIDLILYAPAGKAAFGAFARNNPPNDPMLGDDDAIREGVEYSWWAGSGKFMTDPGSGGNPDDPEYVAPSFAPGAVALLRINTRFWPEDKIAEQNEAGTLEQWERSKVTKYIKDNGRPGTMAGGTIPYYELDGVRIMRPSDVESWLSANNIPGHTWVSGNAY